MTEIELRLPPAKDYDAATLNQAAALKLGISESEIKDVKLLRRSVDARGRDAVFQLRVAVFTNNSDDPSPEAAILEIGRASCRERVYCVV